MDWCLIFADVHKWLCEGLGAKGHIKATAESE